MAEAFGRALVRARHQASMTQEQLADAARLHRTTIGLFERGLRCPSLDTVFHLAGAMKLSAADFVKLVDAETDR